MRIGVCTWSFTPCHAEAGQPLDPFVPEDLARMAVERGLASIECAPGPLQQQPPAQRDCFRQYLADHDLTLFLDTGGHDYTKDISPLTSAIEVASLVGARVVRTTISSMLEGDRRPYGFHGWRQWLQALVDPLRRAMDLAERHGLPVGLENHQDACSWELMWLCEQVGSDQLGVTMDVANALAVGETPEAFARRVLPRLKHVHLKDYTIHPTASGYRFKRCALGDGVVDWPAMVALFDTGAPLAEGCIELGAASARHVRILEADYWATYPPRPMTEAIDAIRVLHQAARPADEDWRTPHEHGASAEIRACYELQQFDRSAEYIRSLAGPSPGS